MTIIPETNEQRLLHVLRAIVDQASPLRFDEDVTLGYSVAADAIQDAACLVHELEAQDRLERQIEAAEYRLGGER